MPVLTTVSGCPRSLVGETEIIAIPTWMKAVNRTPTKDHPSYKQFVRGEKAVLKAKYPFLTSSQIESRLRSEWQKANGKHRRASMISPTKSPGWTDWDRIVSGKHEHNAQSEYDFSPDLESQYGSKTYGDWAFRVPPSYTPPKIVEERTVEKLSGILHRSCEKAKRYSTGKVQFMDFYPRKKLIPSGGYMSRYPLQQKDDKVKRRGSDLYRMSKNEEMTPSKRTDKCGKGKDAKGPLKGAKKTYARVRKSKIPINPKYGEGELGVPAMIDQPLSDSDEERDRQLLGLEGNVLYTSAKEPSPGKTKIKVRTAQSAEKDKQRTINSMFRQMETFQANMSIAKDDVMDNDTQRSSPCAADDAIKVIDGYCMAYQENTDTSGEILLNGDTLKDQEEAAVPSEKNKETLEIVAKMLPRSAEVTPLNTERLTQLIKKACGDNNQSVSDNTTTPANPESLIQQVIKKANKVPHKKRPHDHVSLATDNQDEPTSAAIEVMQEFGHKRKKARRSLDVKIISERQETFSAVRRTRSMVHTDALPSPLAEPFNPAILNSQRVFEPGHGDGPIVQADTQLSIREQKEGNTLSNQAAPTDIQSPKLKPKCKASIATLQVDSPVVIKPRPIHIGKCLSLRNMESVQGATISDSSDAIVSFENRQPMPSTPKLTPASGRDKRITLSCTPSTPVLTPGTLAMRANLRRAQTTSMIRKSQRLASKNEMDSETPGSKTPLFKAPIGIPGKAISVISRSDVPFKSVTPQIKEVIQQVDTSEEKLQSSDNMEGALKIIKSTFDKIIGETSCTIVEATKIIENDTDTMNTVVETKKASTNVAATKSSASSEEMPANAKRDTKNLNVSSFYKSRLNKKENPVVFKIPGAKQIKSKKVEKLRGRPGKKIKGASKLSKIRLLNANRQSDLSDTEQILRDFSDIEGSESDFSEVEFEEKRTLNKVHKSVEDKPMAARESNQLVLDTGSDKSKENIKPIDYTKVKALPQKKSTKELPLVEIVESGPLFEPESPLEDSLPQRRQKQVLTDTNPGNILAPRFSKTINKVVQQKRPEREEPPSIIDETGSTGSDDISITSSDNNSITKGAINNTTRSRSEIIGSQTESNDNQSVMLATVREPRKTGERVRSYEEPSYCNNDQLVTSTVKIASKTQSYEEPSSYCSDDQLVTSSFKKTTSKTKSSEEPSYCIDDQLVTFTFKKTPSKTQSSDEPSYCSDDQLVTSTFKKTTSKTQSSEEPSYCSDDQLVTSTSKKTISKTKSSDEPSYCSDDQSVTPAISKKQKSATEAKSYNEPSHYSTDQSVSSAVQRKSRTIAPEARLKEDAESNGDRVTMKTIESKKSKKATPKTTTDDQFPFSNSPDHAVNFDPIEVITQTMLASSLQCLSASQSSMLKYDDAGKVDDTQSTPERQSEEDETPPPQSQSAQDAIQQALASLRSVVSPDILKIGDLDELDSDDVISFFSSGQSSGLSETMSPLGIPTTCKESREKLKRDDNSIDKPYSIQQKEKGRGDGLEWAKDLFDISPDIKTKTSVTGPGKLKHKGQKIRQSLEKSDIPSETPRTTNTRRLASNLPTADDKAGELFSHDSAAFFL